MRLRIPVSLNLLLLACRAASAQILPADEFFHSGAQSYLTNNIARAREEVDNGLKNYPDDIKLKKLDELLKQQSQQQQQQSKDDQQKQEQKKDEQQKQQAKQDQKDQQKQQDEKQSQEQKDKQKQEQQSKSSGEKQDKEDKQAQPSQPMQAHSMTPQEAQRLLDAQKGEEQFLQFKPAERAERPARTIKDW